MHKDTRHIFITNKHKKYVTHICHRCSKKDTDIFKNPRDK